MIGATSSGAAYESVVRRAWKDAAAVAALILWTAVGCRALLFESACPVGGDKSLFFIGLMSDYGESLQSQRLPFWNDRWGFGFPALAESQTGVFYPPHLVLYRWLEPLEAFRFNLVAHRFLLVLLAYASIRGLGLRPFGSWLAALAFTSSGFVVGHRDHQWAVLAMAWLPAAVWATDAVVRRGSRAAAVMLPGLLAMQLLIGHFQVAFITAVMIGLQAVLAALSARRPRRLAFWTVCVALGYGLAAAQLVPTYRFVEYLRATQPAFGSPEFLSTHALPPVMLVNLVAPFLYFREPLWRDVVWTPLHSAPEECLNYVGLAPLALALGALLRFRRCPFVRCWLVVLLLALALGFGPFLPGHRWLIGLPGFSYFRSAARWTLAVHWSLALLAGWSAEHTRTPRRLGRWWRALLLMTAIVAALLAGWWWCFERAARDQQPLPAGITTAVERLLPWPDPGAAERMRQNLAAYRSWDEYTLKAWWRLERPNVPARLLDCWDTVWRVEIVPTVGLLGLGTVLLWCARRWSRRNRWLIAVLSITDLWCFQAAFPETAVPRASLTMTGPVLGRLGELPKGSRIISPGGNLPAAWGLANLASYRTLDVPLPKPVERLVDRLSSNAGMDRAILQVPPMSHLGIRAILWFPTLIPADRPPPSPPPGAVLAGPDELETWIYGHSGMRELWRRSGIDVRGLLWIAPGEAAGGIVVPLSQMRRAVSPAGILASAPSFAGLYAAQPIDVAGNVQPALGESHANEWTVRVHQPGLFVAPLLFTPGWRAWVDDGRQAKRLPVGRVDGYWCGVELDEPGTYRVALDFTPPGLSLGLVVASSAAVLWIVLVIGSCRAWLRGRPRIGAGSPPSSIAAGAGQAAS